MPIYKARLTLNYLEKRRSAPLGRRQPYSTWASFDTITLPHVLPCQCIDMAATCSRLLLFLHSCALLLGGSHAYSTFKPDCTLPPPGTNYVAGPNTRSTLMILWNCLTIIILCTWNILHLNVPAMRPEPESLLQKWRWTISDFMKKVKWMLVTILVPEFLVGKALGDFVAAREACKKNNTLGTALMIWSKPTWLIWAISFWTGAMSGFPRNMKESHLQKHKKVPVTTLPWTRKLPSHSALPPSWRQQSRNCWTKMDH